MDTEAEVVRDLTLKGCVQPQIITADDNRRFLVHPDDVNFTEISDGNSVLKALPPYISQAVGVQTQDSLVEYVNRYKGADTLLFANIDQNTITALIDYHAQATAARLAHRATLRLPYSLEWKTWGEIDDKLISQLVFARFLEENGCDVVEPNQAELIEACRDLHAARNVKFFNVVRTDSDNEDFEYSVETNLSSRKSGNVEVPRRFLLSIPVYFGEVRTELHAFLRWKVDRESGTLALGIKLNRAEHVRQAVFQKIVLDIAARTGCLAVFGSI